MGFIDHQPGPDTSGTMQPAGKIDNIAIHTEDRIRHHQLGGIPRICFNLLSRPPYHYAETDKLGARHHAAIHDTGMIELIGNHIIAATHQVDITVRLVT